MFAAAAPSSLSRALQLISGVMRAFFEIGATDVTGCRGPGCRAIEAVGQGLRREGRVEDVASASAQECAWSGVTALARAVGHVHRVRPGSPTSSLGPQCGGSKMDGVGESPHVLPPGGCLRRGAAWATGRTTRRCSRRSARRLVGGVSRAVFI
jgi:hypothetical protein